ncbi:MAG TPA: hypothetical protein VIJ34_16010 [Acidimicrobiales bacterium]
MTKFTECLGTVSGILKRKRIPYGDRCVVVLVLVLSLVTSASRLTDYSIVGVLLLACRSGVM